MSDTKLLQSILNKVVSVDNKVDEVKVEVVKNGKRIDKLGLELAELQDDAPTREEHEKLKERVDKVEKQVASV